MYKCINTGAEFFSTAQKFEPVTEGISQATITNGKGEEIPVLVRVKSAETVEGGVVGVEANEEEVDDAEEKKLDYFWQFPDNENDHAFFDESKSSKENIEEFTKSYLKAYSKCLMQKLKAKYPEGHPRHIPEDQIKAALVAFQGWLKTNAKKLKTYSVATYADEEDYTTESGETKTRAVMAALAFQIWEEECHFYFFFPGFYPEKF